MIQDLSGSWCIKGTGESTLVMDSSVPLMHHDPDRFWIIDLGPDHPKGTQPSASSKHEEGWENSRQLKLSRILTAPECLAEAM